MTGRGKLTPRVTQLAYQVLGHSITTAELRLMTYVQFLMVNSQAIDPRKINSNERAILVKWRSRQWIEGGASGLKMSKVFWDAIHEILWLAYVTCEEDEHE